MSLEKSISGIHVSGEVIINLIDIFYFATKLENSNKLVTVENFFWNSRYSLAIRYPKQIERYLTLRNKIILNAAFSRSYVSYFPKEVSEALST